MLEKFIEAIVKDTIQKLPGRTNPWELYEEAKLVLWDNRTLSSNWEITCRILANELGL